MDRLIQVGMCSRAGALLLGVLVLTTGCISDPAATTRDEHAQEVSAVLSALVSDPNAEALRQRAEELNEVADKHNGLVYRTSAADGHEVAFFELANGAGVTVRESSGSSRPVTAGARSIHEIFERLHPGTQLPPELLAVEQRQERGTVAAAPDDDEPESHSDSPAVELASNEKHATSDCAHFVIDHASCPPSADGDGSYCACNIPNGVSVGSNYDAHTHTFYRIDSYIGSVSVFVSISYKGNAQANWQYIALEGNNPFFWTISGTRNGKYVQMTHKLDVQNVTNGKQYHLGGCLDREDNSAAWDCP